MFPDVAMPILTTLASAAEAGGSDHHVHMMLMTMVTALAAGVILIVIARQFDLPAIVLLLLGGVALGPQIWGDAAPVQASSLGDGLRVIVSLFVGLILFEGGLTLELDGYREAPRMIKRLLTAGVLITWGSIAAATWWLTDLTLPHALLAASLVIVTGPTVIGPLLKRVRVNSKLHNILHWEGVLIDPIGVFIALLCYEVVVSNVAGEVAAANLALRVIGGIGLGVVGGIALRLLVRHRLIPDEMINVFSAAMAVLVFGVAEMIETEAGLLAVTVAGFLFGLSEPSKVKSIKSFKAELTDLLVGTLFILLASRLQFEDFRSLGTIGLILIAIVMLVVRPLSIFVCSIGLDLNVRERMFLSWIAPRGIVAASMASIFALGIGSSDDEASQATARYLETFTYSIIVATVVLQGLSAGFVARLLKLRQPEPNGWMIVGAHAFARGLARFIREHTATPVVIVDSNARSVREARDRGFTAIQADARDAELLDRSEFFGIGNVLALTDNEDLNARLCSAWADRFGVDHVFRCRASSGDTTASVDEDERTGRVVWRRLPRPSLLGAELRRSDSSLIDREPDAITANALALLAVRDGRLELLNESDRPENATIVLTVERTTDQLARAVQDDLVMTLDATSLDDLIPQLIDRVVALHPRLNRDDLVQEILERERTFPTRLGHGIALPHAHVDGTDSRIFAVAQIRGGMSYGPNASEETDIVILLLSPAGDPEGHLASLGHLARILNSPARRAELREARTADAVRAVLSS